MSIDITVDCASEREVKCAICYCAGKDVTFKCIQCNNTMFCGSCIAKMQETGCADKCPVCRKGPPWSSNLEIVIGTPERKKKSLCYNSPATDEDSDQPRTYYGKQVGIWIWKFMLVAAMLCLCCLVGYIFVITNDGEMREDGPYPVIMSVIIYTAIGFMILMMCGLVVLVCAVCAISCISLGIPQENV